MARSVAMQLCVLDLVRTCTKDWLEMSREGQLGRNLETLVYQPPCVWLFLGKREGTSRQGQVTSGPQNVTFMLQRQFWTRQAEFHSVSPSVPARSQ